jgi:hypothetical protein
MEKAAIIRGREAAAAPRGESAAAFLSLLASGAVWGSPGSR